MTRKKLNKVQRTHTKNLNSNNKSVFSKASAGGLVLMFSFYERYNNLFRCKAVLCACGKTFMFKKINGFQNRFTSYVVEKDFLNLTSLGHLPGRQQIVVPEN